MYFTYSYLKKKASLMKREYFSCSKHTPRYHGLPFHNYQGFCYVRYMNTCHLLHLRFGNWLITTLQHSWTSLQRAVGQIPCKIKFANLWKLVKLLYEIETVKQIIIVIDKNFILNFQNGKKWDGLAALSCLSTWELFCLWLVHVNSILIQAD